MGTYLGGGVDFTSSSHGQMDTETGVSICLPFAPPPPPTAAVADVPAAGTVSHGQTEQLALSECTSSVFTGSLAGRVTRDEREH